MNTHPQLRPSARRAAFTITEMIAVIAIVVILIVIAVPGFQAMIKSSEEAMAESLLGTAIKAGRDAAFRAGPGNDAAVVFFFEPGGRCTVVPYVRAGSFSDMKADGTNAEVERDIFVPAPEFSPVRLPKYWMVRASVPANAMGAGSEYYIDGSGTARYDAGAGTNWAFPETGFFDPTRLDQGLSRSTFMIRFQGGTGIMMTTPMDPVLVLAPRGTRLNTGSSNTAQTEFDPSDPNRWSGDPTRFIRAVLNGWLSTGPGTGSAITLSDKQKILGRTSSNMVLARPVSAIALYNENQLASALGVRVDRTTDCLYAPTPENGSQSAPVFVDPGINPKQINRWIEGDTNNDGVTNSNATSTTGDIPLAKLYVIDRYTGAVRRLEVQP